MASKLTPAKAVESVKYYREYGWRVFPLPPGEKKPDRERGWLKLVDTITDENITENWARGENIGVVLDRNLVDIDLDSEEAQRLAARFLLKTPFRFGRGSVTTHYVYEAEDAEVATFIDPVARDRKRDGLAAKEMLVEIRHNNGYTMFPPSVHPSGEQLKFPPGSDWPSGVLFKDLLRRVEVLAAVSLMIRYWPGAGGRNEATLALAGGLVRAEREKRMDPAAVDAVVRAVVEEGGNSDPVSDFNAVERTRKSFEKKDDGNEKKRITGWLSLEKALGDVGKTVVRQFREWLDIAPKGRKQKTSALLTAEFSGKIIWEIDGNGAKVPARIAKNVQIILENDPTFTITDNDRD